MISFRLHSGWSCSSRSGECLWRGTAWDEPRQKSSCAIWDRLKMGVPQNEWLIMEHKKTHVWFRGNPHLRKPPCGMVWKWVYHPKLAIWCYIYIVYRENIGKWQSTISHQMFHVFYFQTNHDKHNFPATVQCIFGGKYLQ